MKKKDSKKSLSKKSKNSKDKSIVSKKSNASKSSSKSKSKSKSNSKEKDPKKKSSKKDLEIVTDNKNNPPQPNNILPQATIDLNTNLEETRTPIKNINNFPNYNNLNNNGYISPNSANANNLINFGTQDNFNIRTPNINFEEIKCEGCSEQLAICYCTICKKAFCAQCENQIHSIPAMKDHIRRPIKELAILKKLCLHHNQTLSYYCASCDEAICKECQQLGPHNTKLHAIISIKEAFNNKHMKIDALIKEKLCSRFNKLNINIKIIDKFLEKIIADSAEAERDINKYFNTLLCNLKNAKGKRLAMLDFETGFIQQNIIALEELKDYVFDTKENNDDLLDFVLKFELVKNKMEEILEKPKKLNISDEILELPYEINYEKEKMNLYSQMMNELKDKNNEIFSLLNDTKVYIDNQIMKNQGNLVLLNNNINTINQNMEKSNNRYSILKRPSNASGNKYNYMSYDFNLKNELNNQNLDLLKDIQELMEHGDLNLYQILSDFKSKDKSDSINIQDIPQALKIASIDTNIDEVNNLLDILSMPKKNLVNIKDFLINVLLYKIN